MSVSYGFTNFAWIWLWISKDKNLFEWSFLILFPGGFAVRFLHKLWEKHRYYCDSTYNRCISWLYGINSFVGYLEVIFSINLKMIYETENSAEKF